ncbi:hypothetical protein ABEH87_06815 [Erwinia sp. Eh17-17]|jgi:hypothetical protein|uniref:hypothetical protein n=1 Tax=Erwinia sp. Eh17-17 TaxID=3080330 RepID=UPI0032083293
MKISETLVAVFFLLISAVALAQGSQPANPLASTLHHRNLNPHGTIADTAEMPDERRDDPFHKKHHVTD